MTRQMAEIPDEQMMEELAMANPEKDMEIEAAKAEALFRRITAEPVATRRPAAWRGLPAMAGTAVAAVVVVVGGIWVASSGSGSPGQEPVEGVSPGGSLGMCVELYSLETLANRQFGFDGTVESINGTMVTFRVGEWFRGDGGETVTLEAGSLLALTPDNDSPLEVGARYLVSGDETFAWGCGFTQPYDAGVAGEWAEALK